MAAEFDGEFFKGMTILELQQELKKRGLKKSGVKAKLVQRLKEYCTKHGLEVVQGQKDEEIAPVKPPPKRKEIEVVNPYMEEFEQSLTTDNNVSVDEYLNDSMKLPTPEEEQKTESRNFEVASPKVIHKESEENNRIVSIGDQQTNENSSKPTAEEEENVSEKKIESEEKQIENKEQTDIGVTDNDLTHSLHSEEKQQPMADTPMEEQEEEQTLNKHNEEEQNEEEKMVNEQNDIDEDIVETGIVEDDFVEENTGDKKEEEKEEDDITEVKENKEQADDGEIISEDKPKTKSTTGTPVILKKGRVSLQGSKNETAQERAERRKRRWGASTSIKDTQITTGETIKKLIPDVDTSQTSEDLPELDYLEEDPLPTNNEEAKKNTGSCKEEAEVSSEVTETEASSTQKRRVKLDSARRITLSTKPRPETVVVEDEPGEIKSPPPVEKFHLPKQIIVEEEDEASGKRDRSPSPARNPVSCYLSIRNLVRPFTVNQLKQLIQRTGVIAASGFWINNIKSYCYTQLSSEAEAVQTRQALHGLQWPSGTPKKLAVDFAVNAKMYEETAGLVGEQPKVVIEISDPPKGVEEKKRKLENNRRKIRENNKGKEHGRNGKEENKRKAKDESPAKRLDDLFRKTVAQPCIYWLPLTDEQIAEREKKLTQSATKDTTIPTAITIDSSTRNNRRRSRSPKRSRSPRRILR